MQVLHIDSSITGAASVSRQLTAQTVAALVAANPGAKVEYLDLAVNAPDHLNAVSMGFRTGQAATTEAERAQNAISEALEHQESYLKTVFGFLGITDVSIVRAEGVAMGDEAKAKALASAGDDIVRAAAGAAANQEAALAA
jgi:FMN-dependent NADH-azoreductase